MTSAANAQLRSLVSDYYHGLVSFQSYREQRGSILDGLGAAAPPAVARPARAASAQKPPDETRAKSVAPPVAPQPAPQPAAAPRSRRWLAWGGGAAVVVIAVAGWMALEPSPQAPPAAAGDESPALLPGAALLEQFMQRNAWDRDAIRNLEVAWSNALTDEQRRAALSSTTYGRFSDTLRLRLREEEALSGLEGSAELDTLAELAGRFEVPYSRSVARAPLRNGGAAAAVPSSVAQTAPAGSGSPVPVAPDERAAEAGDDRVAAAVPPTLEAAPVAAATEVAAPSGIETITASPAVPPERSSVAAAPAADGSTGTGPACSAALLSTRRPYCSDTLASGGTGPVLAIVPPGEFEMGGDQTNDERPVHAVRIGAALAMSVYEVSFAEFGVYCQAAGQRCPENPWGSDDFPAALVSWDEAVAYAEWLSAETGQSYRLPSEAEWEYAARAGSRTRYPFGDEVTPSAARSSAKGAVDSPLANSDRSVNRNDFRLYHMIGNLREWVADHWFSGYAGAPTDGTARLGADGNLRVVRGGAYSDGPLPLRSSARASLERGSRDQLTGFRLVRELRE